MKSKDKELLNSLKELDHQMNRLKRFAEFHNRKSMLPSDEELSKDRRKYYKLSSEVEELIYSLTDFGWLYYSDRDLYNYYSEITFEKEFLKSEASEDLVQDICSEIDEVVSHFEERKFNCYYRLRFAGKDQFEHNPQTYRNDLYLFKGLGDAKTTRLFYPEERYEELRTGGWTNRMKAYDPKDHFIAQIILFYI